MNWPTLGVALTMMADGIFNRLTPVAQRERVASAA